MLCCGYTLTDFPISIRLTSLALWQSNDCPSASKATLMNMDKYFIWIHYERLHNHNKAKHNKTVCIFLGIYCTCLWPDANGWVEGYYRSNKSESLFVPTVAAEHDAVIKWKLFRVTGPLCGEFTGHRLILAQRPVTRNFDVFYDLCLNKRLSKQSWGWWFETSSRSSCRHCNG